MNSNSRPVLNSEVRNRITSFWSAIAQYYDSDPGNVPALESDEYAAWIRAIERLLPAPPSDILDPGTGTGFVALIASKLGHRVTGLDLSEPMLAEARRHAKQRGLKATFTTGDAVSPPLDDGSMDAIICRHLVWTLREPLLALANWRRLLRPKGRVVLIDGLWRAQKKPEEGAEFFERHYTPSTREALPAMRWDSVTPLAALVAEAGFSDVIVDDLGDVYRVAASPPSDRPWYVVTGRRD